MSRSLINPTLPRLPVGWIWVPLGGLADVKLGKMLSPKAFEPGLQQLPYLRNENVRWFSIDTDDVKKMGFTDEERDRFRLHVGDLLVCEGGEPGRCAVVTAATADFMIQKALHRVRPRNGTMDARFLQYFFKRFIDAGIVIERRSETTIRHLPREKMLRVPVPLAPLPEQRRIVAMIEQLFSDLDAGVAALERVRANLKRYRAAVLKAAVEGRLTAAWRKRNPTPPDQTGAALLKRILTERRAKWEQDQLRKFKEAGKTPPKGWKEKYPEPIAADVSALRALPRSWTWVTVDACAWDVTVGHVGPMKDRYQDSGIPFLRSQNVRPLRYDTEGLKYIPEDFHADLAKSRLIGGELLVVRSGNVGETCVYPKDAGEANCSDLVITRLLGEVLAQYVAIFVTSPVGRVSVLGMQTGSALPHFNVGAMARSPMPIPPLAEQTEIIAEVDRRLSVADAVEQQVEHALQRAARLRQSVLKRAFEGKLVPQDPADEPAAALLERVEQLGEATPKPRRRSAHRRGGALSA